MTDRIGSYKHQQTQQTNHNTRIKGNAPIKRDKHQIGQGPAKGTPSFKETLAKEKAGNIKTQQLMQQTTRQAARPQTQQQSREGVKFSAHAEQRLRERNIQLGTSDLLEIDKALKQVEAKGSRESLLVYGDIALITSVKNRTVVTALEKGEMKGRVFTNIDSTVLIDK